MKLMQCTETFLPKFTLEGYAGAVHRNMKTIISEESNI